MSYEVFNYKNKKSHLEKQAFLDEGVTIARYDQQRYPWIEKLIDRQLGFFWRPEEIDCVRDQRDFKALTESEQHIFTSNLKRQILLDSVQGRAPVVAFGPVCSLPELETWLQTWTFSETIHSRSYTHIIRNVYADPGQVFDEIINISEIVDCARDISVQYDQLIRMNTLRDFDPSKVDTYEHKKLIWLCLMSVNILEGIRFYASFACSWAFAELKKMEGNAKIIKLICRDENLHLFGTQNLLRSLVNDDPDFKKIQAETADRSLKMFIDAIDQEKAWAKYLFRGGSLIGLNEQLLCDYLEWLGHKRIAAVGLISPFKVGSNPLPWTVKWIAGSDVQQAPQEVALTSYVVGGVTQDVKEDTFKDFKL